MDHEFGFLIATGFTLGLAYAAVPGPVNAETIRRGLGGGFRPALLVQTGAMLGDVLWAVLGLTGAAVLSGSNGISVLLGSIGAGFLLILAHGTFRAAMAGPRPVGVAGAPPARHFVVGAMFSLASPIGIAFWAGFGGGLMMTLDSPSRHEIAVVLGSFMVAVVVWAFVLSAGVIMGRRRATPRLFRVVDAATGVVLGWFGLRLLYSTLQQASDWFRPILSFVP